MLNHLGGALRDENQLDEAEESLLKALGVSHMVPDPRIEGRILADLGLLEQAKNHPQRARSYYKQHLEIARKTSDEYGRDAALYNIGVALESMNKHEEAARYFREAKELADKLSNIFIYNLVQERC